MSGINTAAASTTPGAEARIEVARGSTLLAKAQWTMNKMIQFPTGFVFLVSAADCAQLGLKHRE